MRRFFIAPHVIVTGPGCFGELPALAKRLGRRAIVVVGTGSARAGGWVDKAKGLFNSQGIEVRVFAGVRPEPACDQVDLLREQIRADRADLLIAIGGGSVMDLAKAAAILVCSDKSVEEHLLTQRLPETSLPVIAIPTTAGTGSEATPTSVLTDTKAAVKRSIRTEIMMPAVAIVDAELTCSCPAQLTAIVGMDALTQAIESFCSQLATNITEALSEKAICLISQNLERACRDGSDLQARAALAEGSLLAGLALANARLGAVHGLAHPIGGKYGVPHGLACAVLLPAVLEFNRSTLSAGRFDKYTHMGRLLGCDPVEYARSILVSLQLPQDLKDFRIDRSRVDELAREGMLSGSTKANPRPLTADDLAGILGQVI